jgi:hypothetical protein
MKQLVLIITFLFVVAVIILLNLPPKTITLKEISESEAPRLRQEEPELREIVLNDTQVTNTISKTTIDYYIIVESLRNLTLAQKKAEELKKAFNADFIVLPPTPEGNYRISYGKYSTLEAAKSTLKSLKSKINSKAWILSEKNSH